MNTINLGTPPEAVAAIRLNIPDDKLVEVMQKAGEALSTHVDAMTGEPVNVLDRGLLPAGTDPTYFDQFVLKGNLDPSAQINLAAAKTVDPSIRTTPRNIDDVLFIPASAADKKRKHFDAAGRPLVAMDDAGNVKMKDGKAIEATELEVFKRVAKANGAELQYVKGGLGNLSPAYHGAVWFIKKGEPGPWADVYKGEAAQTKALSEQDVLAAQKAAEAQTIQDAATTAAGKTTIAPDATKQSPAAEAVETAKPKTPSKVKFMDKGFLLPSLRSANGAERRKESLVKVAQLPRETVQNMLSQSKDYVAGIRALQRNESMSAGGPKGPMFVKGFSDAQLAMVNPTNDGAGKPRTGQEEVAILYSRAEEGRKALYFMQGLLQRPDARDLVASGKPEKVVEIVEMNIARDRAEYEQKKTQTAGASR